MKQVYIIYLYNMKPPWLNYMTSSLRQRQNLHIYDFEIANS